MFGVNTSGFPYAPKSQFKSSAIINKTLSFFESFSVDAKMILLLKIDKSVTKIIFLL